MLSTRLIQQLEIHGYQGRIVPIQRLDDLRQEFESRKESLDKTIYQEYLSGFAFEPSEDLPGAQSLIVVAARQPHIRFTFGWNGEQRPVIVPATYLRERESDQHVEDILTEVLKPEGYRVIRVTSLPKKLLAVCSGLAAYGKNNITYVPGMGSFYRLTTFYSDLSFPQDEWRELRMMDRCQNCSACLKSCPSGAITAERFLLRAERCIVHYNEQDADVSFPTWMDPSWHNCLIGCLRCQEVCPENKAIPEWFVEGSQFSSEETMLLLEGGPLERLSAATVEKLEQWGMEGWTSIFPRNLRVLLEKTL